MSDEKTQYIVVDLETGGLDANIHSLLEIGLVAVNDKFEPTACESIKVLENPLVVTPGALKVNHIDLATWDGVSLEQAALALETFIYNYVAPQIQAIGVVGAPTKIHLANWNIGFDMRFLGRLGGLPRPIHYRTLDVMSIFNHPRVMTGQSFIGMAEAVAMMGISVDAEMARAGWEPREAGGAHEAVPDALVAAAIMRELSYTYA